MSLRKQTSVKKYILAILKSLVIISLLIACEDRFKTIQPPGAVTSKSLKIGAPLILSPVNNTVVTNELFKLTTQKKLGDKSGLFELRPEGILIHPGDQLPTTISFKLSRSYSSLVARLYISALPAETSTIKEAGTVGVEFLLNGKSNGKLLVNRHSKHIKALDLTNVETLTVVVDNDDGKPWFDWLMLSAVSLK